MKTKIRTRVKICGFTRAEDIAAAAGLGVDAVGMVFAPQSPRRISIDLARRLVAVVPAFVSKVALFVNAGADDVDAVLQQVAVDYLQFHGEEDPAFCTQFGMPYIKAVRVQNRHQVEHAALAYRNSAALLLDSYQPDMHGGSGRVFDWNEVPASGHPALILAGGLSAENVEQAIQRVQPYAVDVSSGVESAKGIKDFNKMRLFMQAVGRADYS